MGYKSKRKYDINEKLRLYMEENDKKPTAIADKAKIRRDTFSRIIRSQRPLYADEIVPICKALGIPLDVLFNHTNL